MTSNIDEFVLDLSEAIKRVPEQALAFQRVATLEVFRGVVQKSPVGNPSLWKSPAPPGYIGGHFRANWSVSAGTPVTAERQGLEKSPRGAPPSARQQREAEAAIARAQPYSIMYVQNPVPYAEALERGWSTQAPGGVVALTLAEVRARLREALA